MTHLALEGYVIVSGWQGDECPVEAVARTFMVVSVTGGVWFEAPI